MNEKWLSLGESVRFRKLSLYELSWDVTERELSSGLVLASPFGGPLCVLRQSETNESKLEILLYSQTGDFLRKFSPSTAYRIVKGGAGWGLSEYFFIITEIGEFIRLDMCTGKETSIALGKPILHALCMGGGNALCVSMDGFPILLLDNGSTVYHNGSSSSSGKLHLHMGITSLAGYLDADTSMLVMMVSTQDGRISQTCVDFSHRHHHHAVPHVVKTSHVVLGEVVVKLCASPSGAYFACASAKGELIILRSSPLEVVFKSEHVPDRLPSQVCWAGENAVAVSFPLLGLLLVAPDGGWIMYRFGEDPTKSLPFALIPEVDAIRIITQGNQELLQQVPHEVDSAYRIGSTSPCAMLVDASELMQQGDAARANETLRILRNENQLVFAVLDCIRAALGQFDVDDQQVLLRAAANGKVFLSDVQDRKQCTRAFTKACTLLRVLNVVRHTNIGLPLTSYQLERSGGVCNLAWRLARWGHYFLGIRVLQTSQSWTKRSDFLSTMQEIAHLWAKQHIETCPEEETQERDLVERVAKKVSSRFGELAQFAFCANKLSLALALLELERSVSIRVLRLLEFGERDLALRVAEQSKDAELRAYCVRRLMDSAPPPVPPPPSKPLSLFVEKFTLEHARFSQRGLKVSLVEAVRLALCNTAKGEEEALQLKRDFHLSNVGFLAAKVQALVKMQSWALLDTMIKQHGNVSHVVHACLLWGEVRQALVFTNLINDEEERAEAIADCGEFQLAVDFVNRNAFRGNKLVCLRDIRAKIFLSTTLSHRKKQEILGYVTL